MNRPPARHTRARRALVAAVVVALAIPLLGVGATASAAPPGDDSVIAFVARGTGNGHGRGASQWGMFGRSLAGQKYADILATYYGGTQMGARSGNIRVRLTKWDNASTLGVVSAAGTARWNGSATNFKSLYAVETSPNRFSVYGSAGLGCPGAATVVVPKVVLTHGTSGSAAVTNMQRVLQQLGYDPQFVDGDFGNLTKSALAAFQQGNGLAGDGTVWDADDWQKAEALLGGQSGVNWGSPLATNVAGPITFSTTANESGAAPGDVLGACASNGSVNHYRGTLVLSSESVGNRVVNQLNIENYLRGVVPKEVPASWGSSGTVRPDTGQRQGMEALKAQSVAARSFGVSQNRYAYAGTCDTSSCQVYGGSATRPSATSSTVVPVEQGNTNTAIAATATQVRVWSGTNNIVSTEFSASNGPRTAGGTFPVVNDPFDDQPGNPNHVWTRIVDADAIMSRYGLSHANGVRTENDPTNNSSQATNFDGIWDNRVNLGNGTSVTAWDFRNAFGFPSPGFELVPIRRSATNAATFSFIGDSVGTGMAMGAGSEFQILTEGVFTNPKFDAVGGRRTQGGLQPDGVAVAKSVPVGTDLVVVELGYNDDPATLPDRIDALMSALRGRDVGLVAWVNVSERRTATNYSATNAALAAARQRWSELVVLDWESASDHKAANRWFSDGVHLTPSGDAEFSLWLRDRVLEIVRDGYTPPRNLRRGTMLRVPVLGVGGVPATGVGAVALNVTAVRALAGGHLTVWPCEGGRPGTSSVNYVPGGAFPNAVVVPVDGSGEVCVWTLSDTDVVVDVSAWFGTGAGVGVVSDRLVDTRFGIGPAAPR